MSLYRTIQSHIKDFQNKLYTTIPARVIKYDPLECTVDVQPSVNEIDVDGVIRILPELERVPLLFDNVKDSAITFPLKQGDYVLLHFCQNNIEEFLIQSKDNLQDSINPRTLRKHNINDAFATIGVRTYDNSPVKRPDVFDMYFKDTRITVEETGDMTLELLKTDGAAENPQEVHKQVIHFNNDGTTKIEFTKGAVSSNITLQNDGNIAVTTNSKLSVQNGQIELISLLSDLINILANTTVNTVYGASILNTKPQLQNLKTQLDTMKV